MRLTLVSREPIGRAFLRLREAPLENAEGKDVFIYKEAKMRLGHIWPDEVNPTSLYVLRSKLELLDEIERFLAEYYGIDIFNLGEALFLHLANGSFVSMVPPFVEIYDEKVQIIGGPEEKPAPPPLQVKVAILKDGLHRMFRAREKDRMVRSIIVHGAISDYKPYAYPNMWSQVEIVDDVPLIKKFHRRQDSSTFRRPLRVLHRFQGQDPPSPHRRTGTEETRHWIW